MFKMKNECRKLYIKKIFCLAATAAALCCIFLTGCSTRGRNMETERERVDEKKTETVSFSPEPAETPFLFAPGTFLNGKNIEGMTNEEVSALAEKLKEEAQESYECILSYNNNEYRLKSGDIEMDSDAEKVIKKAMKEGGGNYELKFTPLDTPKLREKLKIIADEAGTAPSAPDFKINEQASYANEVPRFLPVNAKNGSKIDIEGTVRKITAGETAFSLPVEITEYSGDGSNGFPDLLSSFVTSFNAGGLNSKGRVHNLKKASKIINGTVVTPVKSFSCSKTLGERSKENGWAAAPAFSNGGTETVNVYGGGICQISTTMYNAVLKADLKVIARRPHSKKVHYVDGGMDAAISGNNIDFIWKNNTADNVYVFMWVNNADNTLHCELYGKMPERDFDEIIIKSEFVKTIPPAEPEFTVDYSLKDGECILKNNAVEGRLYKVYKLYMKNGKVLRKTQVNETQYLMHPAVFAVSPRK